MKRWARSVEPELFTPAQFLALSAQPEGTLVRVLADSAAGLIWRFRYRGLNTDGSVNSSAYKWEWDGGSPIVVSISTSAAIVSAAGGWSDLTSSVGPSATMPLAGDFDVEGAALGGWGVSANAYHGLAVQAGASGTIYGLGQYTEVSGAVFGGIQVLAGMARATATPVNAVYKLQYANLGGANSSTPSFSNRFMRIQPVRVQGP